MRLIFLTKALVSIYLLVMVGMLILAAFAAIRSKMTPKQFDDVLGLIVMWPLTLMNEKMRLRLGHLLNPNR